MCVHELTDILELEEIIQNICSFLPGIVIHQVVSLVCVAWNHCAAQNELWMQLLKRDFQKDTTVQMLLKQFSGNKYVIKRLKKKAEQMKTGDNINGRKEYIQAQIRLDNSNQQTNEIMRAFLLKGLSGMHFVPTHIKRCTHLPQLFTKIRYEEPLYYKCNGRFEYKCKGCNARVVLESDNKVQRRQDRATKVQVVNIGYFVGYQVIVQILFYELHK
jgi:hypothetical protein